MKKFESHKELNTNDFGSRDENAELRWQMVRIQKICEILKTLPDKKLVADVGCMSGMASQYYVKTGVGKLHGFDISDDSIKKLKEKGFEGFIWDADGGKCPAADGIYDLAIASEIIEHLIHTDDFADELNRILKPGGYLLLSTPNLASWLSRIRLLRGKPPRCYPGVSTTIRKDTMIDNHHVRVNVLSEWCHFLQQHGFEIVQTYGSTHLAVLHGGIGIRVLKWMDRVACNFPSFATNIIVLARKKVQNGS